MAPSSEPDDAVASTLVLANTTPSTATITADGRDGSRRPDQQQSNHPVRGEDELDRIDRYVVLRELGRGGMGVVYAAYDTVLDRKVALKLLRDRTGGSEGHRRMVREARALARLSHPHVVGIYEVGEVGQRVFLAMELVDGVSLRTWLQAQPRSQAEILAAFLQAADGLAAAHAAGLVHRDFKPDNVLIGADGRVRVMDFGLARLGVDASEPAAPTHAAADPLLTAAGTLLGTPAYMAPEQHMGLVAYAVADIYSFAVALYEALHGERPFQGTTTEELSARVLGGRMTHVPAPGRIPMWLHAVILRGMALEPAERWTTMQEFAAALRADPRARLRRLLAAAVAIAGVLGLAFGLPVAWHEFQVAREHERVEALAEARLQAVEAGSDQGGAAEADAAFDAFLAAEEHRGTRALARAWLRRGQVAWSEGQVEAALGAMARAYVEANESVDIVAAMRAIAGVHHSRWQLDELAAVLAVLAEHGGDGEPAVLRMRVDAALERNDIGAALAAVTAPAAPRELADLRPLLAPLGRMRPLDLRAERIVPVTAAAGPGFVVLSEVGTRVTLTDARLRPRATLDVPGGVLELVAGRPAYFAVVAGATTLFTWEGGAPTPVWRNPVSGPMLPRVAAWLELADGGAFYFGGQWEWRGFHRLGEADGRWRLTAAHEGTSMGRSDVGALLAEDLDGDGRRELVLGTSVWHQLDLRVFRDGDEGLELADMRAPGRVTGLAVLRDVNETRLAALKDDRYAPFRLPPHTGEEAGVYLYEWRQGRLIDGGHLPLPRRGELAALAIAEGLLACDLDGDGRRDLVAGLAGGPGASEHERDPHAAIFRQRPDGGFDRVVLGVHPLACVQLDDDVADELVVRGVGPDNQAAWALGVGDTPVPPRIDAVPPATAPPFVDPLLAERWTRAGQLAASGLTRAAVEVLEDTAELSASAGDEQRFLVRAAGLLQDHDQTRAAADLYERAARRVALPGPVMLRAAEAHIGVGELTVADRLLRDLLADPELDAPTRTAVRARLSVLTPLLAQTLTVSLATPLAAAWVLDPLSLRHDLRAGGLHLAVVDEAHELASLPLVWSGAAAAMTIDLSVDQVEIGADLEFALVDAAGRTIISTGLFAPHGFPRRQSLMCHDPTQPEPAKFAAVSTSTRARRRIQARVLWDPVQRRVVCDAEVDEHAARFTSRAQALAARPGPARLVIRSGARTSGHLDGELHALTLYGVESPSGANPTPGARQRAARLLVEGRPAEAMQRLGPGDDEPLWRFLALDRLREPIGATAALRRYLTHDAPADIGQPDPLRRLLRLQPDRVGPPLRAILGPGVYRHIAEVMFEPSRYHLDEAWVHELLLTQFPWRDGLEMVDRDTQWMVLLMHATALAAEERFDEARATTWSAVTAANDPSLPPPTSLLSANWLYLAALLAAEEPDAAIAALQEGIESAYSPETTRLRVRTIAEFDVLGADAAWLATVDPP